MLAQNKRILKFMQRGNAITPMSALKMFGCFRLSGRVYDLKKDGHKIERRLVRRSGKNFAEYRIKTERAA